MPSRELAQRIGVAAIGIPITLGLIYLGRWIFGAALAIVAAAGTIELYRMAEARGTRPLIIPGTLATVGFILIAAARPVFTLAAPLSWALALALVLTSAGAVVWSRGVEGRPIGAVGVTLLGALLPGGSFAFALFLRHFTVEGVPALASATADPWAGTALVVYAMGLTWINDTCAYFIGTAWGRRKLIPRVSPGKTVVGAVAGVLGAVIVGTLFTAFVLEGIFELPFPALLGGLGGALIAVVAQVGDLFESVAKREAGVKDSGRLIPGHGGVLDRFDAIFFALPIAYLYIGFILTSGVGAVS